MEIIEAIETRRSCRAFIAKPIPKDVMEKVLELSRWSPSYANSQPWEVAVVSGNKKDELSTALYNAAASKVKSNADIPMPQSWPADVGQRVADHGARRFQAIGIDRENEQQRNEYQLRNFIFFGAPNVVFLFIDNSSSTWSVFDSGLFAQTFTLSAYAYGLGTCLQASIANFPDVVREVLGMPATRKLVLAISIGYADWQAKFNSYRSRRMEINEFVKWHE